MRPRVCYHSMQCIWDHLLPINGLCHGLQIHGFRCHLVFRLIAFTCGMRSMSALAECNCILFVGYVFMYMFLCAHAFGEMESLEAPPQMVRPSDQSIATHYLRIHIYIPICTHIREKGNPESPPATGTTECNRTLFAGRCRARAWCPR